MAAECSGCRIERMFRVQTVKLVGPELSSTSPERRRKAGRKKLRQCRVCGRVRSKKKELNRSVLGSMIRESVRMMSVRRCGRRVQG